MKIMKLKVAHNKKIKPTMYLSKEQQLPITQQMMNKISLKDNSNKKKKNKCITAPKRNQNGANNKKNVWHAPNNYNIRKNRKIALR